jgi:hypothetical protein
MEASFSGKGTLYWELMSERNRARRKDKLKLLVRKKERYAGKGDSIR